MKKKYIKYIIFILILILIAYAIFIQKKEEDDKNAISTKYTNEILNKFDNKEDMILYVTYKDNYDIEANYLIDYLEDVYKLDITYLDLNVINKKDSEKILKEINESFDYIEVPAAIFIKDGLEDSVANSILIDSMFKKLLLKNNYISEKEFNTEAIIDDTNFKEIYSSKDYQLVYISGFGKEFNSYRKIIYENAVKYDFKYYQSFWFIGSDDYLEMFRKAYEKEIASNNLLVIKENKVIDNLEYKDADKLEEFLKKYSFIK